MNTYTAKDQNELEIIIGKILNKDKGAYIQVSDTDFPRIVETNIKIKHP